MNGKYCSYRYRCGDQKFTNDWERQVMDILMEFGRSVDPHGYDDGDYDTAISALRSIKSTEDKGNE